MQKLTAILVPLLLSVTALTAGCKKSDGGGASDLISKYDAIKTSLCACTDKACADANKAKADDLEKSARASGIKPTKDEGAKFEAIEDQINACAHKFDQ